MSLDRYILILELIAYIMTQMSLSAEFKAEAADDLNEFTWPIEKEISTHNLNDEFY